MQHPIPDDQSSESRAPLIPIGLVVLAVFLVPIFLYSAGPEGPAKVGDVVFATDQHRVRFVNPQAMTAQGYHGFCVLEARTQLVVQKTGIPPDGSVIAEVIGTNFEPAPYCHPRVPVILRPHQATLQVNIWKELWNKVAGAFSGA